MGHPNAVFKIALVTSFILMLAIPSSAGMESSLPSRVRTVSPPTISHHVSYSATKTLSNYSQNCLDNASFSVPPLKLRIAVVEPVFTATPYSQYAYGSFYGFYHKYGNQSGNITVGLAMLNTSVASSYTYGNGWGLSYSLYQFMTSPAAKDCGLVVGRNVFLISDINVTEGALFYPNGSSRFDAVILGFSEYDTIQEYVAYKQFVSKGGELILMSGDNLYAEVGYSASSNHEWLITGHGWGFNGKSAWHGQNSMWLTNNSNWIGSYLCCFHRFHYKGAVANESNPLGASLQRMFGRALFSSYVSHEEDSIRNYTDTSIIATFANQSGLVVASYVHQYRRGIVVCFCVFGTDIVSYDKSAQGFLVLSADLGANRTATNLLSSTNGNDTERHAFPIFSVFAGGIIISAIAAVGFVAISSRARMEKSTRQ